MTYQTQESQAKSLIERLKSAGFRADCVWIHTAQLQPENKNPNKMNMIAHLLTPLAQTYMCRVFFLNGGDILLIGRENLAVACAPYIERIRRVLADDAFIKTAGADFFTLYDVTAQADLLIAALSGPVPTMQQMSAQPLYECLLPAAGRLKAAETLSVSPVLQLTPTLKKSIGLLYYFDTAKAARRLHIPPSLINGTWHGYMRTEVCRQTADYQLYSKNQPAFIPFGVEEITGEMFDLFLHTRSAPTIVCLSAETLLQGEGTPALKKLHTHRQPFAVMFENATNFPVTDITKIKPDFIGVPYAELLAEPLPTGIKASSVIVTRIDTQDQLTNVLKWGYNLVQGKIPALIVGALCQRHCPYGDTCADQLCQRIWSGQMAPSQCVFPDFRAHYIFEEKEDL